MRFRDGTKKHLPLGFAADGPNRRSLRRVANSRPHDLLTRYFGCETMRRYGLGDFHPPGYCFCASSFDTLPLMMTSSPGFQFAGVATLCFAVSWIESMTRRIPARFGRVIMG